MYYPMDSFKGRSLYIYIFPKQALPVGVLADCLRDWVKLVRALLSQVACPLLLTGCRLGGTRARLVQAKWSHTQLLTEKHNGFVNVSSEPASGPRCLEMAPRCPSPGGGGWEVEVGLGYQPDILSRTCGNQWGTALGGAVPHWFPHVRLIHPIYP